MPFVPANGVAQVNFRATYLGIPVENVINFDTGDGPIPPGDLAAIGALAAQSWFDNMLPELSDQYEMKEVHVRDLTSATAGIFTDTTIAGSNGANTGVALPGNIAFCVSLRTGFAGRSSRGRVYFPGLVEGDVTGNFLAGARALNLVIAVGQLRADMAASFWSMCIVSRVTAGVPRVSALVTNVITELAVTNRVSTQRRRLT